MKYTRYFFSSCISALFFFLSMIWGAISFSAAGDAKVSVIVQPYTQDIRIVLYDFLNEQEVGKSIVSDEIQFMGQKARVTVFPTGTHTDSKHVRIDLTVAGKYAGGLDASLSGVHFEHLYFKESEKFKPVVHVTLPDDEAMDSASEEARQEDARQEESRQAAAANQQMDYFTLTCSKVMPVKKLKKLPNRAIFNIHPFSTGDLKEFYKGNILIYQWSLLNADLTRIKRGRGLLKTQKANALDMRLELGNRHVMRQLTEISYAFTADKKAFKGSYAECYYLELNGTRVRLGNHEWGLNPEDNGFLGREECDTNCSYQAVLESSGQAMCSQFQIELRRRVPLLNAHSCHEEVRSPFRELLDAPVGKVSIATDKKSNLIFVSLLNFHALPPFSEAKGKLGVDDETYSVIIYPHGSALHPEYMSLSIEPDQDSTFNWLTSMQGCVIYYWPISAREDLHHSCSRYVETEDGRPRLHTSIVPLSYVNNAANCESFIIQPVAGLDVRRQNNSDTPTPFVNAGRGTEFISFISCQRNELALTENGFVCLKGQMPGQGLTFRISYHSFNLWFEVDGIAEEYANGLAELYMNARDDRTISWSQVGGAKRIKTRRGTRSLSFKLDSVSKVMSKAAGDKIEFSLKINES